MRARRSDQATAANTDWSFATPEVLEQLQALAERGARETPGLSAEDALQEMCLYLAVRPEQTTSVAHLMRAAQFCMRKLRDPGRSRDTKIGRDLPLIPEEES